jgi:hypothetical protein
MTRRNFIRRLFGLKEPSVTPTVVHLKPKQNNSGTRSYDKGLGLHCDICDRVWDYEKNACPAYKCWIR